MVRTASRHVAPFALFIVVATAVMVSEVVADPETVEGMYLEKRGDEAILKRPKGRPLPDEDKVQPHPQVRQSSPAFKQGHLGFKSSSSGKAFGAVLGKQTLSRQDSPGGNVPGWLQQLRQKQRQVQAEIPQPSDNRAERQQRGPYPVLKSSGRQGSFTSSPPQGTSSVAESSLMIAASTTSSKIISEANRPLSTAADDLNQLNPQSHSSRGEGSVKEVVSTVLRVPTTSHPNKNGEPATTARPHPPMEKKDKAKPPPKPKVGFLQGEKGDDNGLFSGESRHKAILGIVLGVVFVAVFVAMGIGLAAQAVSDKLKQGKTGGSRGIFSNLMTPNEEDRTPPELRGSGAPNFVQPKNYDLGGLNGGTNGQNGSRFTQPFFNGKLILQDPSASSGRSASSSNAVTSTLFAAHAATLMPSPAEQVTDDLVSPKYDDTEDEATEEEDDSDDTVYECPGLAAPGQEMCVSNPFFLKGRDMPHLHHHREAAAADHQQQQQRRQPQPISQHSNILFHHGIKGVN